MRSSRKGIGTLNLFTTLLFLLSIGSPVSAKNMFSWRVVGIPSLDFRNVTQMQAAVDFLPRMKAVEYNGLTLYGVSMRKLPSYQNDPAMKERIELLLSTARQNGIAIIPMSQHIYGPEDMNQEMVEAFPCKGTPFVVHNGVALAKEDTSVAFVNGDFEAGFAGWRPSLPFFKVDSTVKHGGKYSLRCDDPTSIRVRATQRVKVKPYRTYELSMWVKTQDIETYNGKYGDWKARDVGWAIESPAGRSIYFNRNFNNKLGPNSNWKQVKTYFYSLDRTEVTIHMNASNSFLYTGKVWFDDMRIRDVGLAETIERVNMPVVVKTTSGATLRPGLDYVVGDQKLIIPAGSVVKEGDELTVDWYRIALVTRSKPLGAFCYKEVWDSMRNQIAIEDGWFHTPPARFIHLTEWRTAGWDPHCRGMYNIDAKGSGPYMAAFVNNNSGLYKEANGSRITLVYNDMFDPYHNSKKPYIVTNGGTVGSGYGLNEDIVIMNWCVENRSESLKFFAGTEGKDRPGWGIKTTRQRQIISAAPWDTDQGKGSWNAWLPILDSVEAEGKLPDGSVIGIGFTTYKPFPAWYTHIELMAQACKDAGRWTTGAIEFPPATPGLPYSGVKKYAKEPLSSRFALAEKGSAGSKVKMFSITIPENQKVRLSLFDLKGQEVSRIMDGKMAAGTYEKHVDASKLASGVYFATLSTISRGSVQRITKKVVLF